MEDDLNLKKMEDNLNLKKMEDNINFLENGRRPQFFTMEDDLKYLKIEERKKTSISLMEDEFNFFLNGRRPDFFGNWKITSVYDNGK